MVFIGERYRLLKVNAKKTGLDLGIKSFSEAYRGNLYRLLKLAAPQWRDLLT